MKGSSLRSGGSNDDRVLERIVVFKNLHDVGDSRSLLSNGDIDTVESLLNVCIGVIEDRLLVDDGVNSNSSLSCLSVSNDQLSLSSSNWDLKFIDYLIYS